MSIREPLKALALFIAAFILCGCVKDTTLDAGLERKVVVEFVLTEDNVQNLYLSLTGEPGEKVVPPVQETEIRLIDVTKSKELNRDIVLNEFVRVSDNQWTLDYAGIPGHEYRLEVKADGYDLVWAEQIMPEKVELARAAIGHGVPPKYTGYGAFYTIDSIPDFLIIRGTKRNKETGEYVMVEDLCTDYPGVEDINATGRLYDGNPKWRTGVAWGGDSFVYHDSPVAGMDGVWTYMFPNLIGKELHDGFLLIKRVDDNHAGLDNLYDFENGKGFCISGSFYINHAYYNPDYTLIDYDEYLLYSSLSPDYGQFLKDVWQLKKVHEGDDLSSIYLRDNIHSNIQGGLGIFGTSVSDRVNFDGYNQDTASLPKIEL
ncbi:MAG: DUF4249 family protein [Bacteroidales bacterium]|nr:DUF4249 family protein [Bacteroidales bacterium]